MNATKTGSSECDRVTSLCIHFYLCIILDDNYRLYNVAFVDIIIICLRVLLICWNHVFVLCGASLYATYRTTENCISINNSIVMSTNDIPDKLYKLHTCISAQEPSTDTPHEYTTQAHHTRIAQIYHNACHTIISHKYITQERHPNTPHKHTTQEPHTVVW